MSAHLGRFWRQMRKLLPPALPAAVTAIVVAAVLGALLPGCSLPQASAGCSARRMSPFTGEPIGGARPVLAVKIDNIVFARPQTGLTRADIVYLLPVEGGLSRILAVFSSRFPPVIGPVRSAREEDLQLLRQFGRPAFAWSGAQPRLVPVVRHAHIVSLYAATRGGFSRSANRPAPYNLYASTRRLLAETHGASRACDIGFRFGPQPSAGKPTKSFSISYPAASFTFRWSSAQHKWLAWMDGRPARSTEDGQLGSPTVVIQYVRVTKSGFFEHGSPPPYAQTVGSGRAVVLRDGKSWQVHWSRPTASAGTTFTLPVWRTHAVRTWPGLGSPRLRPRFHVAPLMSAKPGCPSPCLQGDHFPTARADASACGRGAGPVPSSGVLSARVFARLGCCLRWSAWSPARCGGSRPEREAGR
jgi:Protein of unknown function (DUF3048) N-terminal domain/Protein of unknown function (DUF3048) C-terminal domain